MKITQMLQHTVTMYPAC